MDSKTEELHTIRIIEINRAIDDGNKQKIRELLIEYNYEPFFILRVYDSHCKDVLNDIIPDLRKNRDISLYVERAIKADDIDLLCNIYLELYFNYRFPRNSGEYFYQMCFQNNKTELFIHVLRIISQKNPWNLTYYNYFIYREAIKNIDITTIKQLFSLKYPFDQYNVGQSTNIHHVFNLIFTDKKYLPLIDEFFIKSQLFQVGFCQLMATVMTYNHIDAGTPLSSEEGFDISKTTFQTVRADTETTQDQMDMFDYVLDKFPMDLNERDKYSRNILFYITHYKRGDRSSCILFKKLIEKEPRLRSMFLFHECEFVPSDMELEYYFNSPDSLASSLGINVNTIDDEKYTRRETRHSVEVIFHGQTLIQKFLSPPDRDYSSPRFVNVSSFIVWMLGHGATETLNHIDKKGNTALFYACLHDSIPLLSLLIKNGAVLTHEMLRRLKIKKEKPLFSLPMLRLVGGDGTVHYNADDPEQILIRTGCIEITQRVYDFMNSVQVLRTIFENSAGTAMQNSFFSNIPEDIKFNIESFLSGVPKWQERDLKQISVNRSNITLRREAESKKALVEAKPPRSPDVMTYAETRSAFESLRALLISRMQDEPQRPIIIRDGDNIPEPPLMSEPIRTAYGTFFNNTQLAEYIEALQESIKDTENSDMLKVDGTKSRRKKKRRSFKKKRFSRKQ